MSTEKKGPKRKRSTSAEQVKGPDKRMKASLVDCLLPPNHPHAGAK